jgi:hypothetical protein
MTSARAVAAESAANAKTRATSTAHGRRGGRGRAQSNEFEGGGMPGTAEAGSGGTTIGADPETPAAPDREARGQPLPSSA